MDINEALELSKLSYKDPEEFHKKYPNALFFDLPHDTQYYSLILKNKLLIIFRGSSSIKDFLIDSNFFLNEIPSEVSLIKGLKCHSGFLIQFLSAFESLQEITLNCDKDIVILGHSLGGALATICAFSLKTGSLNTDRDVQCITFGSPRVGNSKFKEEFNKNVNCVRVVNSCDAVTMHPYWGYSHVGQEKRIGKITLYKYFGNIKDHYLDSYEKNLLSYK